MSRKHDRRRRPPDEPERHGRRFDRAEPAGPEERARFEAAAREAVIGAGFEVVRTSASPNRRVRLMIDRPDAAPITVGDCEAANRAVLDGLRAIGLDPGDFEVEIESPGADRPLTRPEDFERWRGTRVTVTLRESREGRRNFTGTLLAFAAGDVTVHVLDEPEPETFKAAEIREVRLHPEKEKPPEWKRRGPRGGGGGGRAPGGEGGARA